MAVISIHFSCHLEHPSSATKSRLMLVVYYDISFTPQRRRRREQWLVAAAHVWRKTHTRHNALKDVYNTNLPLEFRSPAFYTMPHTNWKRRGGRGGSFLQAPSFLIWTHPLAAHLHPALQPAARPLVPMALRGPVQPGKGPFKEARIGSWLLPYPRLLALC